MKKMLRSCGRILAFSISLLPAGIAAAAPGSWATNASVGSNQLSVTVQVSCPAITFVCSVVDGYADTQVSTLTGSGDLLADLEFDTLQFESDGLQDWGAGPLPVYNLLSGSAVTFANIPFAGVPEISSLIIFASSDPPIDVVGLSSLIPGDYPFTSLVPYGSILDIVGDLELNVPDIVVLPQTVSLAGTLRLLGDSNFDGMLEYQLRNLSAVLSLQQPGNIGGEAVTLSVTSAMSINLSGEMEGPPTIPVLGGLGSIVLAASCGILGMLGARGRFSGQQSA